jgi:aldose sugar dehydrogenase
LNKRTTSIAIAASLVIIIPAIIYLIHNSPNALAAPSITKDPNPKVETLINGLDSPTGMAFIDNNNILVLEKGGQVRLVSNGALQDKPVLQVSVDTTSERGLLGIAIMNSTATETTPTTALNSNKNKFVFLYYTESNAGDLRNRAYRYDWNVKTNSCQSCFNIRSSSTSRS